MRQTQSSRSTLGWALLVLVVGFAGCSTPGKDRTPVTNAAPLSTPAPAIEIQPVQPKPQVATQLAGLCWAGALAAVRDDGRAAAEIERLRQERYRECILAGENYILGH